MLTGIYTGTNTRKIHGINTRMMGSFVFKGTFINARNLFPHTIICSDVRNVALTCVMLLWRSHVSICVKCESPWTPLIILSRNLLNMVQSSLHSKHNLRQIKIDKFLQFIFNLVYFTTKYLTCHAVACTYTHARGKLLLLVNYHIHRASEGTLSRWSWLHLQLFAPTNRHWARVVSYGAFTLCVIL
jgi:hypothetical protein